MWQQWILTDWSAIGMTVISTLAFYVAIIIYTRISGLRSFSKMSAFDFAMTIALGSLFASVASSPNPTLLLGLTTLAILYLGQVLIAVARRNSAINQIIDNSPQLLMYDGAIRRDALAHTNMTTDDLRAKLREANVFNYDEVKAVVFETTGDVTVLHQTNERQFNPNLLGGVVGFNPEMAADELPAQELAETPNPTA